MRSWTQLKADANSLSGAITTPDQTLIASFINDSIRAIATLRGGKWKWLYSSEAVTSIANTASYQYPQRMRKLVSLQVQMAGSNPVYYNPTPVYDQDRWNIIVASRLGTSDVAMFYYPQDKQFTIAPTPATSGNTFTLFERVQVRDLSQEDYTTGTITTATNGQTAIVGSGTSWTSAMAGRFIRIDDGAQGGDGYWYEIASVTDTTHLTLLKAYEGTSIAAGTSTYKIGEMSPIPESFDIAPLYRAVALYHASKEDKVLAETFWRLYDGGKEAGFLSSDARHGGIIGQMIDEEGETSEGAYISPNPLASVNPNVPPRYPLSGF